MNFKRGGLLERAMQASTKDGVCESCENLIKISETVLGCTALDKFIIPGYLPYHGNRKCKDWIKREYGGVRPPALSIKQSFQKGGSDHERRT